MSKNLPCVYVIDPSVAVTGAFIAARNAARALAGSVRVVLVLPKGSNISTDLLNDFARVEYIPLISLSRNTTSLLRYFPALFLGAWQLRQRMRADQATVLQLNDFYLMHGVLLRMLGFTGTMISLVRCDPVRFMGPLAQPMLWLQRCSANQVVVVSQFIRKLLPNTTNAVLLYEYYDGKVRAPKRHAPSDEKRFVYIGNYIAGKGQDMALRAFAQVIKHDATLRLCFYGGDMGLEKNRAYKASLAALSQELGIAQQVEFHNAVKDSYPIMEQAYAALNFSASESFSMTVLEASGAGVPVIATASGGPEEIIKDGITGHLVPVGDSDIAAQRMLQLAADTGSAAAMGEAGAAHIHAHFSKAAYSEQLARLWNITPQT